MRRNQDHPLDLQEFCGWRAISRALPVDLRANRGHPKELLIVTSLRVAQATRNLIGINLLTMLAHRVLTELLFSIELRPETSIGPGLKIFHGFATVINTDVVIGRDVTLHQCVTMGARVTGGAAPRIGDSVRIGAGAIILGDLTVGDGAMIGAGAVVLTDVPTGATAVGNPARLLTRRG